MGMVWEGPREKAQPQPRQDASASASGPALSRSRGEVLEAGLKYNAIRWRQIFHSNQGKKQNKSNNNNNTTQQEWRSIFRVFKKLLSTVLLEDHFSKLRVKYICSNKT